MKKEQTDTILEFPWDRIKQRLYEESDIPWAAYTFWVKQLKNQEDEGRMIVEVPGDAGDVDVARMRYKDILARIIKEETDKDYKVSFWQTN